MPGLAATCSSHPPFWVFVAVKLNLADIPPRVGESMVVARVGTLHVAVVLPRLLYAASPSSKSSTITLPAGNTVTVAVPLRPFAVAVITIWPGVLTLNESRMTPAFSA